MARGDGPPPGWDPETVGRPDPNVRNPVRVHHLNVDGRQLRAGFFPALAGRGEDVWQIAEQHGPAMIPVVTVVADQVTEAVAEWQGLGDRHRAKVAEHQQLADQADQMRALVEALAGQIRGG